MLKLVNVTKKFDDTIILNNINFNLHNGEIVALVGESGCGKSTMLHIAGLISSINSGQIFINGVDCTEFSKNKQDKLREKIGFIYQFHHLLPEFTVFENLLIPQIISNVKRAEAEQNIFNVLDRFNLLPLKDRKPENLSGGQNQRIAILRAFVKNPCIVLADEPTGNLDKKNADEIFDFILENSKLRGVSSLIVTHNIELAKKTDRIVQMEDLNQYSG